MKKTRTCSAEGCDNPYHAKGLCQFHYGRLWHTGKVNANKPRRSSEIRNANGAGHITTYGYRSIMINGISKFEHTWVVEKALGKELPKDAIIHHIDGNTLNNSNGNLIVFPDQKSHVEFHKRQRAHEVCGNPNWLRCEYCKGYDAPENLYIQRWHKECRNKYRRERYAKLKSK